MFQRFLQLKTPLLSSVAALNHDLPLTSNDWQIISKICNILKRFNEIKMEMSTEKSVTILKTVSFSQDLSSSCSKLKSEHQTIPEVESFISIYCSKITKEVNKRIGKAEKNMLLGEATFLDLRFKKYRFQNQLEFQEVKRLVVNKGKSIAEEKN